MACAFAAPVLPGLAAPDDDIAVLTTQIEVIVEAQPGEAEAAAHKALDLALA
jgi:hypothetical protein